jgi:hypothetical protein
LPPNFRLIKHIFRAINSIISCGNRQLSSTLFLAMGLCFKFEDSKIMIHPCLRFMEELHRSYTKEQKLVKEVKQHLDLLVSDPDVVRLLPDPEFRSKEGITYDSLRQSYNSRYSLTARQIEEIISRINLNSYPDSPWLRNILEIIKIGDLDYALLTRLLRKYMIRPTNVFPERPKLLQLITLAVGGIAFV